MNALLAHRIGTAPTSVIRTRSPLDDVERALLATLITALTDPEMLEIRRRLRQGEITLCIDGDEVTWINCNEVDVAIRDQDRRGS